VRGIFPILHTYKVSDGEDTRLPEIRRGDQPIARWNKSGSIPSSGHRLGCPMGTIHVEYAVVDTSLPKFVVSGTIAPDPRSLIEVGPVEVPVVKGVEALCRVHTRLEHARTYFLRASRRPLVFFEVTSSLGCTSDGHSAFR